MVARLCHKLHANAKAWGWVIVSDDGDRGTHARKARTGLPISSCGVRVIIFATRVLVAPTPPDAIELGLTPDLLADPPAPDPAEILGYFGLHAIIMLF